MRKSRFIIQPVGDKDEGSLCGTDGSNSEGGNSPKQATTPESTQHDDELQRLRNMCNEEKYV